MSETTERYAGHTPGPWRHIAVKNTAYGCVDHKVVDSSGMPLANPAFACFSESDAKLMADAPILLAKYESACRGVDRNGRKAADFWSAAEYLADDVDRLTAQLTAALQENAALTKQLNEAMGRSERDHMKDADRIASLESQLASGAEGVKAAFWRLARERGLTCCDGTHMVGGGPEKADVDDLLDTALATTKGE